MGNAGHLHYAGALAALVLLSGCEKPIPGALNGSEVSQQIHRETTQLRAEVARLQSRVTELEAARTELFRRTDVLDKTQDAISDQVIGNAKAANYNALLDMTRQGMCGTETVRYPDGGYAVRNRECTKKDLRP